jgi:hypothetical protein
MNRIILKLIVSFQHRNALNKLKGNKELWHIITEYTDKSNSIGCSYSDYSILYDYIKRYKPREVLECGTGVSTIVMAYALMENEKLWNLRGRIISMEHVEKWYKHAIEFMPVQLNEYVSIVYSEKKEYYYTIFRGVGYKNIPDIKYDFVFIDGPGTIAPSDNTRSFDFDYINIVMKSDKPVFGIIDNRIGTCYVIQKIFGVDKVKYDQKLGLGFVGPCTKNDIRSKISSESFSHCIRALGKNELNLHMGL